MSQEEDGAPERPANANMPAAAPRPKPPVPGVAPPRPGTPGRATPPPPVPTAAKGPPPPPPPPAQEAASPFLAPESSHDLDDGLLVQDEVEEQSPAPATPASPAPIPAPQIKISPPQPIATVEAAAHAPIAASTAEPAKPPNVAESESPPPFKKRSRAKVLAFVLVPALVLLGGGFVYQSQVAARAARMERAAPETSAEAPVEPPALAHEPAPPPTHTAEPPPSAAPAKKKPAADTAGAAAAVSADPATQAILDTTQLPAGRKIVVDGRVVGTSPRKVAVRCGTHRIVIGDLPPESIAFPCGGEVNFTD